MTIPRTVLVRGIAWNADSTPMVHVLPFTMNQSQDPRTRDLTMGGWADKDLIIFVTSGKDVLTRRRLRRRPRKALQMPGS